MYHNLQSSGVTVSDLLQVLDAVSQIHSHNFGISKDKINILVLGRRQLNGWPRHIMNSVRRKAMIYNIHSM